jgi:hypothetical protein
MTKSGADRAAKYAAKNDATVLSSRATAGKTATDAAASAHQIAMGDLAFDVRGIMNTAGIKPIKSVLFIGYANKLYGLVKKFEGLTATNEAVEVSDAWVIKIDAGQPEKDVMYQIWNLFSAQLGTAPTPFPS